MLALVAITSSIKLTASDVDHLFTGAINAEQDGGDYALKLTALENLEDASAVFVLLLDKTLFGQ